MTMDNIVEDEFFSIPFLVRPLGPRLEKAGGHRLPHITCYGDYGNTSPLGH